MACVATVFGFERVHLAPGASQQLKFTVNATAVALVDEDGHTVSSRNPALDQAVWRSANACDFGSVLRDCL